MMSGQAIAPIVGHAVVVSSDSAAAEEIVQGMRRFSIAIEVCTDVAEAAVLFNRRKFEAVIIDLALGKKAANLLERVRLSASNQRSVTFAIVDPHFPVGGLPVQPNFFLERPLQEGSIDITLKAALGLIIREYRRYFRCPASVPVSMHMEGVGEFNGQLINISEGGAAVSTPVICKFGTIGKISFVLPGDPAAFELECQICWGDAKTRVGVQFRTERSEQRLRLQNWLSRRIEQGLPEATARLFRKQQ